MPASWKKARNQEAAGKKELLELTRIVEPLSTYLMPSRLIWQRPTTAVRSMMSFCMAAWYAGSTVACACGRQRGGSRVVSNRWPQHVQGGRAQLKQHAKAGKRSLIQRTSSLREGRVTVSTSGWPAGSRCWAIASWMEAPACCLANGQAAAGEDSSSRTASRADGSVNACGVVGDSDSARQGGRSVSH